MQGAASKGNAAQGPASANVAASSKPKLTLKFNMKNFSAKPASGLAFKTNEAKDVPPVQGLKAMVDEPSGSAAAAAPRATQDVTVTTDNVAATTEAGEEDVGGSFEAAERALEAEEDVPDSEMRHMLGEDHEPNARQAAVGPAAPLPTMASQQELAAGAAAAPAYEDDEMVLEDDQDLDDVDVSDMMASSDDDQRDEDDDRGTREGATQDQHEENHDVDEDEGAQEHHDDEEAYAEDEDGGEAIPYEDEEEEGAYGDEDDGQYESGDEGDEGGEYAQANALQAPPPLDGFLGPPPFSFPTAGWEGQQAADGGMEADFQSNRRSLRLINP